MTTQTPRLASLQLPKSPFASNGYLPAGFHPHSVSSFGETFSGGVRLFFDEGAQRKTLFSGLEQLVGALEVFEIPTEQWIGGSFVTTASAPKDLDVVNLCDAQALQQLTPESKALLQRYVSGKETQKHCGCDSYLVPTPTEGHPLNDDYKTLSAYWLKRFGHDRAGIPKGIVSIQLGLSAPEPESTEDSTPAPQTSQPLEFGSW